MAGQETRSVVRSSRGRPRDPHVDDAILDTTITMLGEVGIAGLTIDALIARAGVTRSMLYRRWRSKEEVIHAAVLRAFTTTVPAPDTGDIRTDLVEVVRSLIVMMTKTPLGKLFPALVAEAARDPGWAKVWTSVIRRQRKNTRVILDRAVARGQLKPGVDPELVLDLASGIVHSRVLVWRDKVNPTEAPRIVDAVLDSLTM